MTFRIFTLALAVFMCLPRNGSAASPARVFRTSIVKIYCTIQRPDYSMPWQGGQTINATGSGFIIGNRRILTNAHIVSDARFIHVQKDGNSARFQARVTFSAHDCDLATLTVDDDSFFDDTKAVAFSPAMPELNDEVTVLGYPLGGTRLSITKGVVSRIDYSLYSHSGVDQHLVLQVDAAINPGNSGGPIIYKGKVVGLAFQGLSWAENIGYAIPLPVIGRFLTDIADGSYNGYPELGVMFMELRNSALRRDLLVPDEETGAVVQYIDPFGSAVGFLKPRDVLLSIDGYRIANDGTVDLDGNVVIFAELLERKQWGESVNLSIWRDGARSAVQIPLTNRHDPFLYRNQYDVIPEYTVIAGLVFSPLSREYVETLDPSTDNPNRHLVAYYHHYAKVDDLYRNRDEFVVLLRRLPHSVNTYADRFVNGIVKEVNGVPVKALRDVRSAVDRPLDGFHVIRFEGIDDCLVLDAREAAQVDADILRYYGVPAPEFPGDASHSTGQNGDSAK